MAIAILTRGKTAIRDNLKELVTHLGVSTDQTAFDIAQVALDPANVGAANNHIEAVTELDVDAITTDYSIEINGATEFTGKTIWTMSLMNGITRTDPLSRRVRTVGVGIQSDDVTTVTIRATVEDNS